MAARIASSSNGFAKPARSTFARNAPAVSCDSPRYGGIEASPKPTTPSYSTSVSITGVVVRELTATVKTCLSWSVYGRNLKVIRARPRAARAPRAWNQGPAGTSAAPEASSPFRIHSRRDCAITDSLMRPPRRILSRIPPPPRSAADDRRHFTVLIEGGIGSGRRSLPSGAPAVQEHQRRRVTPCRDTPPASPAPRITAAAGARSAWPTSRTPARERARGGPAAGLGTALTVPGPCSSIGDGQPTAPRAPPPLRRTRASEFGPWVSSAGRLYRRR